MLALDGWNVLLTYRADERSAHAVAGDCRATGVWADTVEVDVASVRLGLMDTDIHARNGEPRRLESLAPSLPMRRPGTADEAAAAICWLLSDQASYVTGAHVDVAGGR